MSRYYINNGGLQKSDLQKLPSKRNNILASGNNSCVSLSGEIGRGHVLRVEPPFRLLKRFVALDSLLERRQIQCR